jgi:hypothetical protein
MAIEGDFFPPDFKQFPFKAGDLLANRRSDGRYSITKILRVDKIVLLEGQSISIQGQKFTAPEDDFLLTVSAAYGESEFESLEQARLAATTGKWKTKLGHVPNRPAGAAEGQVLIGFQPIHEDELVGYYAWRQAFDKGEAGIF